MTSSITREASSPSHAPEIAANRVEELQSLIGNHAELVSTEVWDDVTRQIIGVVTADAMIVAAFPSVSPLSSLVPDRESRDQFASPDLTTGSPNV